jgi:hypothetical protein
LGVCDNEDEDYVAHHGACSNADYHYIVENDDDIEFFTFMCVSNSLADVSSTALSCAQVPASLGQ